LDETRPIPLHKALNGNKQNIFINVCLKCKSNDEINKTEAQFQKGNPTSK
jgi:hypothetical protein